MMVGWEKHKSGFQGGDYRDPNKDANRSQLMTLLMKMIFFKAKQSNAGVIFSH